MHNGLTPDEKTKAEAAQLAREVGQIKRAYQAFEEHDSPVLYQMQIHNQKPTHLSLDTEETSSEKSLGDAQDLSTTSQSKKQSPKK